MSEVIQIRGLKKYFGKTHAVDGVDVTVSEGEIFGFLGPNGAGKTTLIRCLMDFIRPTAGKITILGKNSITDSAELKKDIGFLPGNVRLYDSWTGKEHITFFESLGADKKFADELSIKLDFDQSKKFKNLSSGNKQKLGVILALMKKPKLLIMDEPTNALDPLLQNQVHELLKEEKKNGTTVFISSHNLSEVDRICDRVAIIKDGKIIATEDIRSLKDKRIHTTTIYLAEKVKKSEFEIPGVENVEEIVDGLVIRSKGDIGPLLKKITDCKLKDIEITHASLEEIFLEFYNK